MNFDDFAKLVEVLADEESNILRELYIANFVDTNKEYYKENIINTKLFSDGYAYTGYLWDCLLKGKKVTFQHIFEKLSKYDEVLVLWDRHTRDRIFIENY